MRTIISASIIAAAVVVAAQQPVNPRQQPGAQVHIFAPDQHDLYDGHFVISANRIHMVGGLNDPEGWDHLDNDAKTVKPVSGTAEIDVNEIANTGIVRRHAEDPRGRPGPDPRALARIQPLPERRHRRLHSRARHGFRVRRQQLAEDGWLPRRVGLWQRAVERQAALPGLRDALHGHAGPARSEDVAGELSARHKKLPGGETNPATQQIDFYIRSPQQNAKNRPSRQVFVHFFGMEITWK